MTGKANTAPGEIAAPLKAKSSLGVKGGPPARDSEDRPAVLTFVVNPKPQIRSIWCLIVRIICLTGCGQTPDWIPCWCGTSREVDPDAYDHCCHVRSAQHLRSRIKRQEKPTSLVRVRGCSGARDQAAPGNHPSERSQIWLQSTPSESHRLLCWRRGQRESRR